jgi:antirestriction protein
MEANIKIYVANLGKYNEGELVGEWIKLPVSDEELEELFVRIKVAHYNEAGEYIPYYEEDGVIYEEVAIHDYESNISELRIGEWENIEDLNELAEELEYADIDIISAIIEATDCDLKEALDRRDGVIFYKNMSMLDVAYEIIDDCYSDLPEIAKRYFDYEAFARDLSYDNFYEVENGVIVL